MDKETGERCGPPSSFLVSRAAANERELERSSRIREKIPLLLVSGRGSRPARRRESRNNNRNNSRSELGD